MRIFINFFLLFFSMSCSPDKKTVESGWDVVIHGKVGHPQQGGIIQIQEMKNDGSGKRDTARVKSNYTYSKKIHLTEPGIYGFNFFGKQVVNLMVDKANIELNVDGNNAQGFLEIKGSPDHDVFNKVQQLYQESQQNPRLSAIEADYQKAASVKDEKKMSELQGAYMAELDKGTQKIIDLLKQTPASLVLYNLLQDANLIDKDKHFDLFATSLQKFKASWPNYSYTRELDTIVQKMKVTAVGQLAPEIALPNPGGQVVKLSSMRGKYVLIDFWAKWCGPCRRENPNVVKAYHRFKSKGFEVFGVSLDRNKEDWMKAIQEDGLVWTHVSDLKYFDCKAARDYNINAIPFSILLDKEGKIIAKNLRGAALEKKLEEVLGAGM
jgi:peroxiredoxin